MKTVMFGDVAIQTDNRVREVSRIHGSGTIVREYMVLVPARAEKEMCVGCHDDFYNHGGNGLGGGGCWSFKSARVVDKVGHSSLHVMNGPDGLMKRTLSCWHGVSK